MSSWWIMLFILWISHFLKVSPFTPVGFFRYSNLCSCLKLFSCHNIKFFVLLYFTCIFTVSRSLHFFFWSTNIYVLRDRESLCCLTLQKTQFPTRPSSQGRAWYMPPLGRQEPCYFCYLSHHWRTPGVPVNRNLKAGAGVSRQTQVL